MKAFIVVLIAIGSTNAYRIPHQCRGPHCSSIVGDTFVARIDSAVTDVARILKGPAVVRADQAHYPAMPHQSVLNQLMMQAPHRWHDKYLLVEWMTDTMLAALHQSLELLELTPGEMTQLQDW